MLKGAAIFHGELYFFSSFGLNFNFKFFISYTPASITDLKDTSSSSILLKYFSLRIPKKFINN